MIEGIYSSISVKALITYGGFNFFLYSILNYNPNIFRIKDSTSSRKIHKNPIPIFGGFIIYFNLILYVLDNLINFTDLNLNESLFYLFIFLASFSGFFLTGLFDDIYDLKPIIRILSIVFFSFIMIHFNQLGINFLSIGNLKIYLIHPISICFTIFCFLALLNALNLFDGINGQVGVFSITIIIFIWLKGANFTFIFFPMTLGLITFLVFNFRNKTFLGDSGVYLISFILSYSLIEAHNSFKINTEEVILILLFPGLDMLRVSIKRIILKKSPFSPDTNHLHHRLLEKYNYLKSFFIIQICLIIPFLMILLNVSYIYILITSIMMYIVLLNTSRKKLR